MTFGHRTLIDVIIYHLCVSVCSGSDGPGKHGLVKQNLDENSHRNNIKKRYFALKTR